MGSSFAFHVVVVVAAAVVVVVAAAGVVVVVVVVAALGAAALFSLKAFHGPHYEYTTKVRQPIHTAKNTQTTSPHTKTTPIRSCANSIAGFAKPANF